MLLRKFCMIQIEISGKFPENNLEHAMVYKWLRKVVCPLIVQSVNALYRYLLNSEKINLPNLVKSSFYCATIVLIQMINDAKRMKNKETKTDESV